MRVLLVDDDPGILLSVRRALEFEGYTVPTAIDGVEALDAIEHDPPDAVVLDVTMPRLDGLQVCRHLRSEGDKTPILVLTTRHAVADRVEGLDAGADDYLVKPFALEELLARVRALLRRHGDEDGGLLRLADLEMDVRAHTVRRGGGLTDLTRTEWALLELLLRNAGQVLTRELISDRVWGTTWARRDRSTCTSATSGARPRSGRCPASSRRCAAWGSSPARASPGREPEVRGRGPGLPGPNATTSGPATESPGAGDVSLRGRLTLVVAVAVGVAVLAGLAVAWLATQQRLRAEVDDALEARAEALVELPSIAVQAQGGTGTGTDDSTPGRPPGAAGPGGPPAALVQDTSIQLIATSGEVTVVAGSPLPVDERDRAVAEAGDGAFTTDVDVDGHHVRLRTQAISGGGAIQVGRDVAEIDQTLEGLALLLALTAVVGVAVAALVGLVVAKRSLRPIGELTEATERVAQSRDLTAALPTPATHDEVGRLTESFNTMLAAPATSREQQQRLVTDASHELRTPLASLRTTIELLQRADAAPAGDLSEAQRAELYDHAVDELRELTHLATELVDLATDAPTATGDATEVRLDRVAEAAVERARRRTSQAIALVATPTMVMGHQAPIERAVTNLVDNACKWNPLGTTIDIEVSPGRVQVRDHGPGVPADERERVFERFARGRDAQSVPGSGLGLSIVRQVADDHGGRAWLEGAEGGGTVAVLEFSGDSSDS